MPRVSISETITKEGVIVCEHIEISETSYEGVKLYLKTLIYQMITMLVTADKR